MMALGIRQAAAACGVDPATVKRRLRAGQFPQAYKDQGGRWMIPPTDLLAAGLALRAPGAAPGAMPQTPPPDVPQGAPVTVGNPTDDLRDQLAAAELRAAVAEERAAGLEAVLAERAATVAALTDALRLAGRQLEAGPTGAQPDPTEAQQAQQAQRPPRRRRWGRRRAHTPDP